MRVLIHLTISPHTSTRLAELAFVFVAIAGALLVLAGIRRPSRTAATVAAGVAFALSGVLLIVATHWGRFH